MATIQRMLCVRLDELIETLGLDLQYTSKMYYGACPIHGGDNTSALNIYHSGETVPGFWKCYTKQCHEHYRPTIIGFVRGVLSAHENKEYGFVETVKWCCDFLRQDIKDIKVDEEEIERRQFAAKVKTFCAKPVGGGEGMTQEQIRSRLVIPAEYYVNRGWSPKVLDEHDVGLCDTPGRDMYNRVVVPVYNKDGLSVGCTGRSIFDKCVDCGLWHNPKDECPVKYSQKFSKWRNSFNREMYLYNFYQAEQHIRRNRVIGLCEGPPDVWRTVEAGINYCVGMFGVELTDQQQVLIEMSGAMSIVVLTNMDSAGKAFRQKIRKQVGNLYRLFFPELPPLVNDLGDLPATEVRERLLPVFREASYA